MSRRALSPRRGQHHRGLAIATGAGLALALAAAVVNIFIPHNETLWHLIAAPQEDGAWRFRIIDGRDVSNVGYAVRVHWGEIVGWYDGCNECGRSEDGGMMTCTLQACVAYPSDPLYRLFAQGRPAMSLRGDSLILTVPGHRAVLDRAAPGRR